LQELLLENCFDLKEFPKAIEGLTLLMVLDLSWCGSIRSIPTTIGKLKQNACMHQSMNKSKSYLRFNQPTFYITRIGLV